MKKIAFTLCLTFSVMLSFGQQFGLYNSRTLYDAFENPSQKAFRADTSRKYAFNLLIPTVSFTSAFRGPAENSFRALIYDEVISGRGLVLGNQEMSTITAATNTYMIMFRIFNTVEYNREMGFSWQIRNDGRVNITNETFAILDDFNLFTDEQYLSLFNNSGYNQSYNQYSFTYREDMNKRLSIGGKFSLLSGITYNSLDINQSVLNIRKDLDEFDVQLKGNFKSSYLDTDLNSGIINPTFKDPGVSAGLSASYKFRGGWFLMGNLKDIGFIKWNKDSYNYNLDNEIKIDNGSLPDADERLNDGISETLNATRTLKSYTTKTVGKAEALLSRQYGNYHPNLIFSKNVFYEGGHLALVNNYKRRNLIFTGIADYNFDNYLQLGGQFMIQSGNVEFFIGSDRLLKTISTGRALLNKDSQIGKGYSAASAYLGFSMKFGPVMEHQANSNFIPGMNANHDRRGIFRRLFGRR